MQHPLRSRRSRDRIACAAFAVLVMAASATAATAARHPRTARPPTAATAQSAPIVQSIAPTATAIKHVIVVIGENHTFDNVFGTYQPPAGQTVRNLLSEGIVTESGDPGPNVGLATQVQATDTSVDPGHWSTSPTVVGPYATLPQPNTTYVDRRCDNAKVFAPDPRFPADLPNAPFQITRYVPYAGTGGACPLPGAFVGDPLHRFYQMWQQTNEGANALYTWVDETAGDSNGNPPPPSTHQGALSMGFYNMAQGDAPALDYLAQHFSMSDNYHQAVQGGTMANHIAMMTGNAAEFLGPDGQPATPPTQQIENPDPLPGTNNHYTQDGYSGGSYSECADSSQAGVGPIDSFLGTLGYTPFNTCAPDTYYLLNNYNAPYDLAGNLQHAAVQATPQTFTTIGDELSAHGIDWAYYGQGYHRGNVNNAQYCGVCDAMQYSTAIMTNPTMRAHVQHGMGDFNTAVDKGMLPPVSFVKPESNFDGHPGYSTLAQFETFASQVVSRVASNPTLFASTAILITMDEGGGYYDSGYVQPVSFLGDGPRIPMIVVSPFTAPGSIDHVYTDHVSVLKLIEANWMLPPLGSNTEDNLQNPTPSSDAYVPGNRPAIGDLMSLFSFARTPAQIAASDDAARAVTSHLAVRPPSSALDAQVAGSSGISR
jgi:phospholipase C